MQSQNYELMNKGEIRNPNNLLIVSKLYLEKYPEKRQTISKYYDARADRPLDDNFLTQVKNYGSIHSPVFIINHEEFGDVVIAGRQRVRAAIAAGFTKIPVIVFPDDDTNTIELEISENLARSENTPRETYLAVKKALETGKTREEISKIVGCTEAGLHHILLVGEMPDFIPQLITKGHLTTTAAIQLAKSFGKKGSKDSGRIRLYDKDAIKSMKESITSMSEEARLKGDKKITVKQARESKANSIETLSPKEWDSLIEDESVPSDFKLLIMVFRNKLSYTQARNRSENLNWLRKIVKPKAEKKVKEAKVKVKEEVEDDSFDDFNPNDLFA